MQDTIWCKFMAVKIADYLRPMPEDQRRALALAAGTSFLHLRNVAFSGKSCGAHLAVALDRATDGAVRRWDCRPHDWHLIWPELIGADGAPPLPTEEARDAA
jgi:hypothetical protein